MNLALKGLTVILGSIKTIIFIGQNFAKNTFFNQVFHQRCLQKKDVKKGLCTFTEQTPDGKLQNLQNVLSEMCFLYDPVCYALFFRII